LAPSPGEARLGPRGVLARRVAAFRKLGIDAWRLRADRPRAERLSSDRTFLTSIMDGPAPNLVLGTVCTAGERISSAELLAAVARRCRPGAAPPRHGHRSQARDPHPPSFFPHMITPLEDPRQGHRIPNSPPFPCSRGSRTACGADLSYRIGLQRRPSARLMPAKLATSRNCSITTAPSSFVKACTALLPRPGVCIGTRLAARGAQADRRSSGRRRLCFLFDPVGRRRMRSSCSYWCRWATRGRDKSSHATTTGAGRAFACYYGQRVAGRAGPHVADGGCGHSDVRVRSS